MNSPQQQLANLIFALDKAAAGVSGYLNDAARSFEVIDFDDVAAPERFVMECNFKKCVEQALLQQQLCDQIRGKAIEVLANVEHLS